MRARRRRTANVVLAVMGLIMVAFTAAVLLIFWRTGQEPVTLITCVFGLMGMEGGVLGWIRTSKERTKRKAGGKPPEEGEDQDAGK